MQPCSLGMPMNVRKHVEISGTLDKFVGMTATGILKSMTQVRLIGDALGNAFSTGQLQAGAEKYSLQFAERPSMLA